MAFYTSKLLQNPIFQGVLLVLVFVLAYWVPFSSLFNTWMTSDDYSYGLAIPFISFYFFWNKKQSLKHATIKSFWPVFPVLLFFVLVSIYGVLGSSGHISRPALPILIVLFAIFCFGLDVFKRIRLSLCFLVFMIPLPDILDRTVGVFLKNISSQLGGMLLRTFGYSVNVSGNVIDLGTIKLQVVDACSGLRFVFPLLALGFVYAQFFERVMWKKILCVLMTIPVSILTNVLRIGITGLLTYHFGSKMAEGFFHDFQGIAIFLVAFVLLFLFGRVLRFFSFGKGNSSTKEAVYFEKRYENKGNISAVAVSVILLFIVGGLTLNTKALPPIKIKGGIESFPTSLNGWKGEPMEVEQDIINASGAEEAFSCLYRNSGNQAVSLYLGYRSTAFLENVNFFHSPTVCFPSSGWKVISRSKHIINDVPLFKSLSVTEMVVESMGTKYLLYFWFQTKNKATHDKNINRFHLTLHAIKKDNTHDLFIRPMTVLGKDESVHVAQRRMDGFVRQMLECLFVFLEKNQL